MRISESGLGEIKITEQGFVPNDTLRTLEMASSRFNNKDAYCSMNLETALNEPVYDRISEQILDG